MTALKTRKFAIHDRMIIGQTMETETHHVQLIDRREETNCVSGHHTHVFFIERKTPARQKLRETKSTPVSFFHVLHNDLSAMDFAYACAIAARRFDPHSKPRVRANPRGFCSVNTMPVSGNTVIAFTTPNSMRVQRRKELVLKPTEVAPILSALAELFTSPETRSSALMRTYDRDDWLIPALAKDIINGFWRSDSVDRVNWVINEVRRRITIAMGYAQSTPTEERPYWAAIAHILRETEDRLPKVNACGCCQEPFVVWASEAAWKTLCPPCYFGPRYDPNARPPSMQPIPHPEWPEWGIRPRPDQITPAALVAPITPPVETPRVVENWDEFLDTEYRRIMNDGP